MKNKKANFKPTNYQTPAYSQSLFQLDTIPVYFSHSLSTLEKLAKLLSYRVTTLSITSTGSLGERAEPPSAMRRRDWLRTRAEKRNAGRLLFSDLLTGRPIDETQFFDFGDRFSTSKTTNNKSKC